MITEKTIFLETSYGHLKCNLKDIMKYRKVSMYKLSKITGLKYDVLKKYYYSTIVRYDSDVIAKFCYVLECDVKDLIIYVQEDN